MNYFIENTILHMRQFQKDNNITKQCMTNSQYLYDTIKMNSSYTNVYIQPFMVCYSKINGLFSCMCIHLAVVIDDEILEPSNEIYELNDAVYCKNVSQLKGCLSRREYIKKFIDFYKLAETMNNGQCIVADKDFYNKQADYVEKMKKIKHPLLKSLRVNTN
jgi:hypothetical protein